MVEHYLKLVVKQKPSSLIVKKLEYKRENIELFNAIHSCAKQNAEKLAIMLKFPAHRHQLDRFQKLSSPDTMVGTRDVVRRPQKEEAKLPIYSAVKMSASNRDTALSYVRNNKILSGIQDDDVPFRPSNNKSGIT